MTFSFDMKSLNTFFNSKPDSEKKGTYGDLTTNAFGNLMGIIKEDMKRDMASFMRHNSSGEKDAGGESKSKGGKWGQFADDAGKFMDLATKFGPLLKSFGKKADSSKEPDATAYDSRNSSEVKPKNNNFDVG
jgi:hypothetical protein